MPWGSPFLSAIKYSVSYNRQYHVRRRPMPRAAFRTPQHDGNLEFVRRYVWALPRSNPGTDGTNCAGAVVGRRSADRTASFGAFREVPGSWQGSGQFAKGVGSDDSAGFVAGAGRHREGDLRAERNRGMRDPARGNTCGTR